VAQPVAVSAGPRAPGRATSLRAGRRASAMSGGLG